MKNYARPSEDKKQKMSETLSEIYPTNPKTSGSSANIEGQPSTSKITVTEDMNAEPENENMLPLTDSQLERVFDQIPQRSLLGAPLPEPPTLHDERH